MDPRALVAMMAILLVMIPVAGITMTLTIRFALKPFVETLATALRESGFGASRETDLRLADMEEQIQVVVTELRRLDETQAFDRPLLKGAAKEPEGR